MPCVHVKSWDLNGEFFDGDILAGPVPTLFSANSLASLGAIIAAPEKVTTLNELNALYYMLYIIYYL